MLESYGPKGIPTSTGFNLVGVLLAGEPLLSRRLEVRRGFKGEGIEFYKMLVRSMIAYISFVVLQGAEWNPVRGVNGLFTYIPVVAGLGIRGVSQSHDLPQLFRRAKSTIRKVKSFIRNLKSPSQADDPGFAGH